MSTWARYEQEKRYWLDSHPDATPQQVAQAMREIARRLGI